MQQSRKIRVQPFGYWGSVGLQQDYEMGLDEVARNDDKGVV